MPGETSERYQLSPQQTRLLRLQRGDQSPLRAVCILGIDGDVDVARLRASLMQLAAVHEILRAAVVMEGALQEPLLLIHPEARPGWAETDWREIQDGDEVEIEHLLAAHGTAGASRLVGIWARDVSSRRSRLVLSAPSILLDSVGFEILLADLCAFYHRQPREPLRLQFVDLIGWQQELATDRQYGEEHDRWKATVQRLGMTCSVGRDFAPRAVGVRLPSLPDRTMRDGLLAMWTLLASLHQGAVVGEVAVRHDGRNYEGLDVVIGPLARFLPFREAIEPNEKVEAFIARVGRHYDEDAAVQEYFDPSLLSPSGAGTVYLDWAFELDRIPDPRTFGEGSIGIAARHCSADRYGLKLSVACAAAGPTGWLHFDATRFSRQAARAVAGQFEMLAHQLAVGHHCDLGDLTPVTEQARADVLDWSRSRGSPASPLLPVHEMIARHARDTPTAVALRQQGQSLTYAELDTAANRMAHALIRRGVAADQRVAVLAERSPATIIAMLAILKAGAAYVPVDPTDPPERQATTMHLADVRHVLTANEVMAVPPGIDQVPCCALDVVTEAADPTNVHILLDQLAYVLFTSGSTGTPKGVMITHRALANYLAWSVRAYGISAARASVAHTSLAFDLTVTSLWAPLVAGACVDLAAPKAGIEGLVAALVREKEIGLVKLTPTHLRLLAQRTDIHDIASRCPSFVIGGEALFQRDVTPWLDANPQLRIFNEYGPTEAAVGCCCQAIERAGEAADAAAIGWPIDGLEVYVLDRQLRLVPPGVVGEIYIGGVGLARGYVARPDLTAARFVPHPFSAAPGQRLYRTGDIGRRRFDGKLEFCGRVDDQIKVRGYRVEIAEIEAALIRHPHVNACAVAVRQDDSHARIVAYVVADPGPRLTDVELRDFLRQHIPDYMVPTMYMRLDALPVGASGKVDRRKLPDPGLRERTGHGDYLPPQSFQEQILAAVWGRTLGVQEVGIDDNYFALGGDSIHAIRVVAEARQRGLALSIDLLFAHPTIRELARAVGDDGQASATLPAVEPFALLSADDKARLPDDVVDAYPLSALQAGMLYAVDYFAKSAIYHDVASYHLRLRRPINFAMFQLAVDVIVADQPALRTAFDLTGYSEPLQLVRRRCALVVTVRDVSVLGVPAQEAEVEAWIAEEKKRPFDPTQPPLIRLHLHLRGGGEIQFSLGFHHAILDGWSEATFLTELFERYFALCEDDECRSNSVPAGLIPQFLALERAAIRSPECREFWRRVLDGVPPLDIIRPRPGLRRVDGSRGTTTIEVPIPEALNAALHRISFELAVPIKSVLLATHVRVLAFLGGEKDVLTAMVGSGRPEGPGGATALGLFLNSFPVRLSVDAPSLKALVRRCFEFERTVLPYRRFPFAEIKRMMGGRRTPDTLFYFTHYHVFQGSAIREQIEPLRDIYYEETTFSLVANFWLNPFDHRIHLNVTGDATKFAPEAVAEFADCYRRALEALGADPNRSLADADLLPPHQRRQLEALQGEFVPAMLQAPLLHKLVERQARERAESVAVRFREVRRSYADLDRSADRIAEALWDAGVRPGSIVAVRMPRSDLMVIALLACLKAGAAFLPLDPDAPRDRLAWILEQAAADIVLVDGDECDEQPAVPRLLSVRGALLQAVARPAPPHRGDLPIDASAYVMYTSGTTGRPKGVVVTHRAIVNRLLWMQSEYSLDVSDRVLQKTPYIFDVALWDIFWPLIRGAELVLAEPDRHADPQYLVQAIEQCGITTLHFVPSMLRAFLRTIAPGRCESLKRVIVSGEALSPDLPDQLFERLPGVELHNLYGPTEAAVDVTSWQCRFGDARSSIPIGHPIANLRIYVLDPWLRPAPIGTKGEIYIAGVGLALGYLNQPGLTAQRFLPDCQTANPGERMYRTGDVGRWSDEGCLEFLGRVDNQLKLRGYRIEPGEIEVALHAHPRVLEAAVVVRELGGEPMLVAFVVPNTAGAIETAELRRFLTNRLPTYMIPAVFELRPWLPRTASGKLDRAMLAPAEVTREATSDAAMPRSPLEQVLCGIWSECIGAAVGPIDNFFEIGGYSIAATRIVALIRERLNVELPLTRFFDTPTVRDLAAFLEHRPGRQDAGTDPPIRPGPSGLEGPLSFAQQRLWFLEELEPHNASFIIPGALLLDGPLGAAALELALQDVVRRHDILRTAFPSENGRPRQRVDESFVLRLTVVDLCEFGPAAAQAHAGAIAREETRRTFDLTNGPLIRATLLRISSERHMLALALHHLVADGWSIAILAGEIAFFYRARLCGAPDTMPALPIQFRDFAMWERARAGKPDTATDWQSDLELCASAFCEPLPNTGLPGHRIRLGTAGNASRTLRFELQPAVVNRLREVSRRNGCTLFMMLMTGFKALIRVLSGIDDIAVLTDVANRPRAETQGLIGFFVNQLLLRDNFAGDATLRSMLRRVRDTCFTSYVCQHVPFDQVVRHVSQDDARIRRWLSTVPKLVLQDHRPPAWGLAGLAVTPIDIDRGATKLDLLVNVLETGASLTGWWEYRESAFEAGAAEMTMLLFQHTLAVLGESPDLEFAALRDAVLQQQRGIRIRQADDVVAAGSRLLATAVRRSPATPPSLGAGQPGSGSMHASAEERA
jgi:amino acid adenylation domain-containing protein